MRYITDDGGTPSLLEVFKLDDDATPHLVEKMEDASVYAGMEHALVQNGLLIIVQRTASGKKICTKQVS
jgi:hypothetical protein